MDKRTLLAFLFIALILMLMPYYYRMVGLSEREEEGGTTVPSQPAEKGEGIRPRAESALPEAVKTGPPSVVNSIDSTVPVEIEKIYFVRTALYTASVSSRGGGCLTSFILNDFLTHEGEPVNLIRSDLDYDNLFIRFDNVVGDPITLSQPFSLIEDHDPGDMLSVGPDGLTLTFHTDLAGRTISKSLVFHSNTYLIDVSVDLSSFSKNNISQEKFTLSWDQGLPITEKNFTDDIREFDGRLFQGGELNPKRKNKPDKNSAQAYDGIGQTSWAAIRSKYFLSALIPKNSSNYGRVLTGPYDASKQISPSAPIYTVAVGFSSSAPALCHLYLGPLKYDYIKGLGVDLHNIMSFGWPVLRPISRGVLLLLTSMHKYVPNYGLLLIIFSILVKIVVYPLTKKSYKSTKEMQALQPLIMELRNKYKGDSQKLNKATMSLYKEHGVNPLGGCLPMLLQMPLLFALFIVFRTTIELRQAPFIWWIDDLSSPDALISLPFTLPLYGDQVSVLPILMGVSMFIQQKMMGTQASGQQKYMSYFMTGFFLIIFNQFPSGLNLYYTLFNVLTILQQKYLVPSSTAVSKPLPTKRKR